MKNNSKENFNDVFWRSAQLILRLMKFSRDLWHKVKWYSNETYAYSLDYLDQFQNWINGTYCLYFSEGFYLDSMFVHDVCLWIGPDKRNSYKRIFVSNEIRKITSTDLVMLRIPEMVWVGKINPNVLTPERKKLIEEWVKLNEKLILKHCEFEHYNTSHFFKKVKGYVR